MKSVKNILSLEIASNKEITPDLEISNSDCTICFEIVLVNFVNTPAPTTTTTKRPVRKFIR